MFHRNWKTKNVALYVRSAAHLEGFSIKRRAFFLHVSNVFGVCRGVRRGVRVQSHASYAESWFSRIKRNIKAFFWSPEKSIRWQCHYTAIFKDRKGSVFNLENAGYIENRLKQGRAFLVKARYFKTLVHSLLHVCNTLHIPFKHKFLNHVWFLKFQRSGSIWKWINWVFKFFRRPRNY